MQSTIHIIPTKLNDNGFQIIVIIILERTSFTFIDFFCVFIVDLHTPSILYHPQRTALHHPDPLYCASLCLWLLAQPPFHQQRPVLRLLWLSSRLLWRYVEQAENDLCRYQHLFSCPHILGCEAVRREKKVDKLVLLTNHCSLVRRPPYQRFHSRRCNSRSMFCFTVKQNNTSSI